MNATTTTVDLFVDTHGFVHRKALRPLAGRTYDVCQFDFERWPCNAVKATEEAACGTCAGAADLNGDPECSECGRTFTTSEETPDPECQRCGEIVEDAGAHADYTGHWPSRS